MREPGRDLGDRVAGGLGRQRGRPRDARVHLDDDQLARVAVQRELDVRAAGLDADRADHGGRRVAQRLVLAVGERLRGRDGGRVAGVHPHRVDVLDRADDHDVVDPVADHLELELAPARRPTPRAGSARSGSRAGRARRRARTPRASSANPPPCPPSVNAGRTTMGRCSAPVASAARASCIDGRDDARRHAQADRGHGRGEELAVLGAADGVVGRADQLDAELVEDAVLVELRGQVERRLAARASAGGRRAARGGARTRRRPRRAARGTCGRPSRRRS